MVVGETYALISLYEFIGFLRISLCAAHPH